MNIKKTNLVAIGIAFGTAIVAVIGIAMDTPALGISLGICIGAAVGYTKKEERNIR